MYYHSREHILIIQLAALPCLLMQMNFFCLRIKSLNVSATFAKHHILIWSTSGKSVVVTHRSDVLGNAEPT